MSWLHSLSRTIRSYVWRHSLTIGFVIIALCIAIILYMLTLALQQLRNQVSDFDTLLQQTATLAKQSANSSTERDNEIAGINRHLDCIVKFFSQPDRSQTAIDNIETCSLAKTSHTQAAQGTEPSKTSNTSAQGSKTDSAQPAKPTQAETHSTSSQQSHGGLLYDLLPGLF